MRRFPCLCEALGFTLLLSFTLLLPPVIASPPDSDGDGLTDDVDNCPYDYNPDQADIDADGIGDICDPCPEDPTNTCVPCPDTDADGICDEEDNCPFIANPDQTDLDLDRLGDPCDPCPDDQLNTCAHCVQLPREAVGWWPGDGEALDIIGDNSPSNTIGSPTFVPARVRDGMQFHGNDGYVVSDSRLLNIYTYDSITLLGWLKIDSPMESSEQVVIDKRAGSLEAWTGYVLSVRASAEDPTVEIHFSISDGSVVQELSTKPVPVGDYHHFAVVLRNYFDTIALYLDGQLEAMQFTQFGSTNNDSDLYLAHPSPQVTTELTGLIGVLDEFQLYLRALTSCEFRAIHAADTEGVCREDADTDGILDYADICPLIPNPGQEDLDRDYAGDVCDCMPDNYDVYHSPCEASGLMLGVDLERDTIGWCSQFYESGYGLSYTLVRGLLSELPVGTGAAEICVASALNFSRFTDPQPPPSNDGYWYVLRGANACGTAPFGFDSMGNERTGPIPRSCPTTETELCVLTGGWWDIAACGHYTCGLPNDCDAIFPGCDCGLHRNFTPGVGCTLDPECP
jgi:hypothetical protein